jgi:hypothetical protein
MAENDTNRGKSPGSEKTRFKEGTSGNPGGRPQCSKNRSAIIRKVLGQVVTGEVDGRKKKIALSEAILLRAARDALNGNAAAIKTVLMLWKESEDAAAAEFEAEYPYNEKDHQVIDECYARMKACEEPVIS